MIYRYICIFILIALSSEAKEIELSKFLTKPNTLKFANISFTLPEGWVLKKPLDERYARSNGNWISITHKQSDAEIWIWAREYWYNKAHYKPNYDKFSHSIIDDSPNATKPSVEFLIKDPEFTQKLYFRKGGIWTGKKPFYHTTHRGDGVDIAIVLMGVNRYKFDKYRKDYLSLSKSLKWDPLSSELVEKLIAGKTTSESN